MENSRKPGKRSRTARKSSKANIIGIIFLFAVLIAIVAACVLLSSGNRAGMTEPNSPDVMESRSESDGATDAATDKEAIVTSNDNLPAIAPAYDIPEEFNSEAALCIRRSDHKAIISLNADEKEYPASIVKVMTVVVALEMIDDWDETVTLPTAMFAKLLSQNASVAGFVEGERVKASDLVYAAMLPSGADGSLGLAYIVAGSEEAFVKLMNDKAAELGMTNTHFANATGLHTEDTYSTARDLVTLFDYALKNDKFREVIGNSQYTTSPTNKHPGGLTMSSTVYTAFRSVTKNYDYIVGGKTGYTPEAGQTLITCAKINDEEYILVTLGAGNGEQRPKYNAMDAVAVYSMITEQTSSSVTVKSDSDSDSSSDGVSDPAGTDSSTTATGKAA